MLCPRTGTCGAAWIGAGGTFLCRCGYLQVTGLIVSISDGIYLRVRECVNAAWNQSSVYFAKLAAGCHTRALALVFTEHCVWKTVLKSNCMVCFGSLGTWYWLHVLFSLRVQIWPNRLEQLRILNAQPYSQKTASETFFMLPPWRVWIKQIKMLNETNRRGQQSEFHTCPAGQNFLQWLQTCERTKQRVARWCEGPRFPWAGGRERLGEVEARWSIQPHGI